MLQIPVGQSSAVHSKKGFFKINRNTQPPVAEDLRYSQSGTFYFGSYWSRGKKQIVKSALRTCECHFLLVTDVGDAAVRVAWCRSYLQLMTSKGH